MAEGGGHPLPGNPQDGAQISLPGGGGDAWESWGQPEDQSALDIDISQYIRDQANQETNVQETNVSESSSSSSSSNSNDTTDNEKASDATDDYFWDYNNMVSQLEERYGDDYSGFYWDGQPAPVPRGILGDDNDQHIRMIYQQDVEERDSAAALQILENQTPAEIRKMLGEEKVTHYAVIARSRCEYHYAKAATHIQELDELILELQCHGLEHQRDWIRMQRLDASIRYSIARWKFYHLMYLALSQASLSYCDVRIKQTLHADHEGFLSEIDKICRKYFNLRAMQIRLAHERQHERLPGMKYGPMPQPRLESRRERRKSLYPLLPLDDNTPIPSAPKRAELPAGQSLFGTSKHAPQQVPTTSMGRATPAITAMESAGGNAPQQLAVMQPGTLQRLPPGVMLPTQQEVPPTPVISNTTTFPLEQRGTASSTPKPQPRRHQFSIYEDHTQGPKAMPKPPALPRGILNNANNHKENTSRKPATGATVKFTTHDTYTIDSQLAGGAIPATGASISTLQSIPTPVRNNPAPQSRAPATPHPTKSSAPGPSIRPLTPGEQFHHMSSWNIKLAQLTQQMEGLQEALDLQRSTAEGAKNEVNYLRKHIEDLENREAQRESLASSNPSRSHGASNVPGSTAPKDDSSFQKQLLYALSLYPSKNMDIKIPPFDGKLEKWEEFWDLFVTTVDQDPRLNDVHKVIILKNRIKEGTEVEKLLEPFPTRPESYALMVNALKARYGDMKRTLFYKKIKGIFAKPPARTDAETKYMVTHLKSLVSMLKYFDIDLETSAPIRNLFLCLFETKIPRRLGESWQHYMGKKQKGVKRDPLPFEQASYPMSNLASVTEFLEFCENRLKCAETSSAAVEEGNIIGESVKPKVKKPKVRPGAGSATTTKEEAAQAASAFVADVESVEEDDALVFEAYTGEITLSQDGPRMNTRAKAKERNDTSNGFTKTSASKKPQRAWPKTAPSSNSQDASSSKASGKQAADDGKPGRKANMSAKLDKNSVKQRRIDGPKSATYVRNAASKKTKFKKKDSRKEKASSESPKEPDSEPNLAPEKKLSQPNPTKDQNSAVSKKKMSQGAKSGAKSSPNSEKDGNAESPYEFYEDGCIFCPQDHNSKDCMEVEKMSPKEIWSRLRRRVRSKQTCFRCFDDSNKHIASSCPLGSCSEKCPKRHHPSMCTVPKAQNLPRGKGKRRE